MTPEREKEIRMACSIAGELLDPAIPDLLDEIDRLRVEFETAAMKCTEYQMEAYKLRNNLSAPRYCFNGDRHEYRESNKK